MSKFHYSSRCIKKCNSASGYPYYQTILNLSTLMQTPFPTLFSFDSEQAFMMKAKVILLSANALTLSYTILTFNDPEKEALLKTLLEKEKMLVTSIFSCFPQCFILFSKQISISESQLNCHLQMPSIWSTPEFCHLVKSPS